MFGSGKESPFTEMLVQQPRSTKVLSYAHLGYPLFSTFQAGWKTTGSVFDQGGFLEVIKAHHGWVKVPYSTRPWEKLLSNQTWLARISLVNGGLVRWKNYRTSMVDVMLG